MAMQLDSASVHNTAQAKVIVENKTRRAVQDKHAAVLADIYQDDVNIAIWQRENSEKLQLAVAEFLQGQSRFEATLVVKPNNVTESLQKEITASENTHFLLAHIAELVDMFALLFDQQRVGLRVLTLDKAMCPKFHVDRVTCRLVTTLQGQATEWLPHNVINRSKLGKGSNGFADSESGLYQHPSDIQQLNTGDVALLKGELWKGNDNAGLVHRSPALSINEKRLLVTCDFCE